MVKCPQCLQLRDDGDTPCPHCGEVPYGIRNRPSQRIAEKAPAPREEPKKLSYGGLDLDLGDVSASGLELAGEDDAPTAEVPRAEPPPTLAEPQLEPLPDLPEPPLKPFRVAELPASAFLPSTEEMEAKRLADYGDPKPGPIGAVRYWWRVSTRRSELGRRRAEAAETLEAQERERTNRLAELGRTAEEAAPSESEPRAGLVRAVRAAERRREEEAHLSTTVVTEREQRLGELRARLAALEAEIAPLAESSAGLSRRLGDLRAETRRTESALKRAEIERRNVVDLIARRQEAYAELERPADERGRLLAEIAELDKKSPELNARVDAARAKLESLAQPLDAAQKEHDVAARLLADRRKGADDLQERVEEAELELEAERARSGKRSEEAGREVVAAWAAVGENVLPTVDAGGGGPLAALARGAAESTTRAEEAALRLARLDRAITCFDHDAFAQGKTYAIVGGSLALVVLTILIVVIIS